MLSVFLLTSKDGLQLQRQQLTDLHSNYWKCFNNWFIKEEFQN